MNLLDIKRYPEKVLRQKCKPVERVTGNYREFFRQMIIAMYYYGGIGLAAPQVGVDQRLIVADIGNGPVQLADPEIMETSGSDDMQEERCLSLPEVEVKVQRPYKVVVKGMNDRGKLVEIKTEGLFARVLQHEIDHLNGKLIVDYLGFFSRLKFKFKRR